MRRGAFPPHGQKAWPNKRPALRNWKQGMHGSKAISRVPWQAPFGAGRDSKAHSHEEERGMRLLPSLRIGR